MAIQENFCPKCGGKTTNEGLCNKCKAESVDWLVCEPRVECIVCPTCGSMKRGSIWTDVEYDRQKLSEELAFSAVSVHEDVEDLELAHLHERTDTEPDTLHHLCKRGYCTMNRFSKPVN